MPERVLELMSLVGFIIGEAKLRQQGQVHTLASDRIGGTRIRVSVPKSRTFSSTLYA